MVSDILLLAVSILLLYGTADLMLRSSVQLATNLGLSPRVVGLTIVAFGTSVPETLVCLVATLEGRPSVAIGNVLGSNIANIGLVLGGAALVRPIPAEKSTIARDLPTMVGATVLMIVLAFDGVVSRLDGAILLAALSAFIVSSLRSGSPQKEGAKNKAEGKAAGRPGVILAAALVGVAIAAKLLVTSAVNIGEALGISPLVIGLSVVALGTSLPEAATTWLASIRRHGDLGLGNVIGSNVYNIGAVLGLTALVRPLQVDRSSITMDMPAVLLFSVLLFPMLRGKLRLSRRAGLILVLGYASYMVMIFNKS